MIDFFLKLSPVIQALLAGFFTFFVTALGSSIVYLFKSVNRTFLDGMLGFSAGVMIAASFFSLLNPAIILCEKIKLISWLTVGIGFLFGGLLLFIGDKVFTFLLKEKGNSKLKRSLMLVISITLHNIPEGLAVGVAFGSVRYHIDGATTLAACLLTLGIALQNFPEGSAVSLPLKREGLSPKKAFIVGSLSAIVEPISAVIGALIVLKVRFLLPFLLSFAAGAMIYVVIEEIIPESQTNKSKDLMAFFSILGFILMMTLDVALG